MHANAPREEKSVYDWNRRVVGTVREVHRDPKTNASRSLIVNLSPEARQALGAGDGLASIPMNYVSGIRRESVTLDRPLTEIRQIEILRELMG